VRALKIRTLIKREFDAAFEKCDVILSPTSPFPAFKIGEKVDDPLEMYLSDIYTITGDLAGIPCMSVPCGKTADGLPVGMQVSTRHFDETTMFRLADAYERR
jgi:aspartyl-tRNA(Asn)/glutamyl-tRNA(Gln) amidotransferase subunit A